VRIFVHLTPEKNVREILRHGITRLRQQGDHPKGVFAMPAARSFHVSHQWLGELKERGHLSVAGLYLRIPEDETVWVGHYLQSHKKMSAAEASELFIYEHRPEGFEIIVPRAIRPDEIYRIHHLAQVRAWRYRSTSEQKQAAEKRRKLAA
jgi:hypothetical protein